MNIRQLVYFIAIAEKGNFTQAAKALRISQPALSIYLSTLESRLGIQLVDKTKGAVQSVRLTEAGKLYLETAREISSIYSQALHSIRLLSQQNPEKLVCAATPYRQAQILIKGYNLFSMHYPSINLQIIEGHIGKNLELLAKGEVTLTFNIMKDLQPPGLVCIPCAQTACILALPTCHPLAPLGSRDPRNLPTIELERFQDTPFILGSKHTVIRQCEDRLFAEAGFQPVIIYECDNCNRSLLESMIAAGNGASLLMLANTVPLPEVVYFRLAKSFPIYICACTDGHELTEPERYLIYLHIKTLSAEFGYFPFLNEVSSSICEEFELSAAAC